jgi:hypothetical protein
MASVSTGEILFPLFVELGRSTRNEADFHEVDELLHDFDYGDFDFHKMEWGVGGFTVWVRVLDIDDFDKEEVDALCDSIEEELITWENKYE